MRISRSFVYAAEALTRLAHAEPGTSLSAAQLADSAGISSRFLLHVLRMLVEAGLLRSRKGPAGGYTLARSAADISLLDILEAVEGPLRMAGVDDHRFDVHTTGVLAGATEAVRRRWASIALETLAADQDA